VTRPLFSTKSATTLFVRVLSPDRASATNHLFHFGDEMELSKWGRSRVRG